MKEYGVSAKRKSYANYVIQYAREDSGGRHKIGN
jgi:hypothetical protein